MIEDEPSSESEASDAPELPKPSSHHSGSEPPEDLSSTLRKTRDEDRTKGKAVSRQIVRAFVLKLSTAIEPMSMWNRPSGIPSSMHEYACKSP